MKSKRRSRAFYRDADRITKSGDVSEVLALLDSPDLVVRLWAVKAIRRRGLTDAAQALHRLAGTDDDLKLGAMLALERFALPESRATFIDGLADEHLSLSALRGLFAIGDPQAVPAAEEAYRRGNNLTRQNALYAMRHDGSQDAIDALRRLLDAEQSWRWRRLIKKALREANSKTAAPGR
jgi:HEAT repeat protein